MKRSGCRFWYASFYDATGKQIRVSTRHTVKQKALVKLRELMGKSEAGFGGIGGRLHYADLRRALLADYTSRGRYEMPVGLKQLDEFVGYKPANGDVPEATGLPASRLNTDLGQAFTKKRHDEGAGNAMINRSLACLRRMLRLAYEDGKIPAVPKIRFEKEPPARKGFLERSKFEELLGALPPYLRPYVALLYWVGSRKTETRMVDWTQVDLDARTIRLEAEQTKTDEARVLPIPAPVVEVLRRHEPKSGLVFDTTNLRVHWEKACASVGLGTRVEMTSEAGNKFWKYDGLMLHDLRRSAVRNLRLAGASETVSMKISGHKTSHVFRRYNIVTTGDIMDAMRAVEVHAAKQLPTAVEVGAKLGQKRSTRKRLTAVTPRS